MKVKLDYDEWYPVYSIQDTTFPLVDYEVPDETVERWKRAFEEFRQVQREMEAIVGR